MDDNPLKPWDELLQLLGHSQDTLDAAIAWLSEANYSSLFKFKPDWKKFLEYLTDPVPKAKGRDLVVYPRIALFSEALNRCLICLIATKSHEIKTNVLESFKLVCRSFYERESLKGMMYYVDTIYVPENPKKDLCRPNKTTSMSGNTSKTNPSGRDQKEHILNIRRPDPNSPINNEVQEALTSLGEVLKSVKPLDVEPDEIRKGLSKFTIAMLNLCSDQTVPDVSKLPKTFESEVSSLKRPRPESSGEEGSKKLRTESPGARASTEITLVSEKPSEVNCQSFSEITPNITPLVEKQDIQDICDFMKLNSAYKYDASTSASFNFFAGVCDKLLELQEEGHLQVFLKTVVVPTLLVFANPIPRSFIQSIKTATKSSSLQVNDSLFLPFINQACSLNNQQIQFVLNVARTALSSDQLQELFLAALANRQLANNDLEALLNLLQGFLNLKLLCNENLVDRFCQFAELNSSASSKSFAFVKLIRSLLRRNDLCLSGDNRRVLKSSVELNETPLKSACLEILNS